MKAFAGIVCAALALAACSSEASGPVHVGVSEEAIIGGVALSDASMDAVGSLVYVYRYPGSADSYSSPFCSGTLISNREVLTAEHCIQNIGFTTEIGFAIGATASRPKKVVSVVALESEQSVKGGYLGLGSDVAVLHLGEPVKGVEPLTTGVLAAEDVGRRFIGIGFGTQDVQGTSGTRRGGSMTFGGTGGRLFERAFGSFEGFLAAIPNIDEIRYQVGDTSTSYGLAQAQALYDGRVLLDDYEGYFGGQNGDAQSCHGDSGGPILRIVDGKKVVFGVTSWGTHRFGSFCDYGAVYGVFGPATRAFLTTALEWVDPCEGLTTSGVCNGTAATRCSAPKEGVRRKLVTECADVGLACGAGADGQVTCK
jgi:hypothetical protein